MNSNRTRRDRTLSWVCVMITIVLILLATFATRSPIVRILVDVVAVLVIFIGARFYVRSRSTNKR